MPRTVILIVALIVINTSHGQGAATTLEPTTFTSASDTRNSTSKTPLLAKVYDIYNSIVELSEDFSRFPMNDSYVTNTVSMLFFLLIGKIIRLNSHEQSFICYLNVTRHMTSVLLNIQPVSL